MTTTPEPTAGTAQPTVLDLLQASPVGPVLDMPVPGHRWRRSQPPRSVRR